MLTVLAVALAAVWGYLLGALPTGVLVSRALGGTDVRQHGSGHTGGLNVSRSVGAKGGALTVAIDALLGLIAVAAPALLTRDPWAAAAGGLMAVVGHDWSVFIHFGGGIGLSTLTGALFYLEPLRTLGALLVVALLWFVLVRPLNCHRARSTILVMATLGPLLWGLGASTPAILVGALGGAAVIVKTLPDWDRAYD